MCERSRVTVVGVGRVSGGRFGGGSNPTIVPVYSGTLGREGGRRGSYPKCRNHSSPTGLNVVLTGLGPSPCGTGSVVEGPRDVRVEDLPSRPFLESGRPRPSESGFRLLVPFPRSRKSPGYWSKESGGLPELEMKIFYLSLSGTNQTSNFRRSLYPPPTPSASPGLFPW